MHVTAVTLCPGRQFKKKWVNLNVCQQRLVGGFRCRTASNWRAGDRVRQGALPSRTRFAMKVGPRRFGMVGRAKLAASRFRSRRSST